MEHDRYTQTIRAEYEAFTARLSAQYLTVAGNGMDAVASFRLAGLGMISALLGRAIALTNDYLAPLGGGVVRDARELPWLDQLRQIAIKNLNDLIVKLMGGGLRQADMLNRPAGAFGALLQKKLEAPRLTVRDRAGRAWKADALVAGYARDFAYQAYLDAQIARLKEEGAQVATIVYPDPTHRNHGMQVNLADIDQVRKTIFHPNSNARLVAHV